MKNQTEILNNLPAGVYITSYSSDNLVAIENITKDSAWDVAVKLDIQREMNRTAILKKIRGDFRCALDRNGYTACRSCHIDDCNQADQELAEDHDEIVRFHGGY